LISEAVNLRGADKQKHTAEPLSRGEKRKTSNVLKTSEVEITTITFIPKTLTGLLVARNENIRSQNQRFQCKDGASAKSGQVAPSLHL